MARILVYGDSNSWGFPPDGSGVRFGRDIRWPQVYASLTKDEVIEDCLPGRTVDRDDFDYIYPMARNGWRALPASLRAQSPVDAVLIMLGTNDNKTQFRKSAKDIAQSLINLAKLAAEIGSGKHSWEDLSPPQIGLIAPPPLAKITTLPTWDRYAEWKGGYETSRALASELDDLCQMNDFAFFDGGLVASADEDEGIHLDAKAHIALGQALAKWRNTVLNPVLEFSE